MNQTQLSVLAFLSRNKGHYFTTEQVFDGLFRDYELHSVSIALTMLLIGEAIEVQAIRDDKGIIISLKYGVRQSV